MRRLNLKRKITSPVVPGVARDHMKKIEWSGDRSGGTLTCPTCGRAFDSSAPNEGHELPGADGTGGCDQKRIIDAPAGGGVNFDRHSEAFPEAIGCDTCQLFDTCSIRLGLDKQIVNFGHTYFGITDLEIPPGATIATKLMVSHALVAEACGKFKERKT